MFVNFNPDHNALRTLSEASINHPDTTVRHRAATLYWLYYGYSEKGVATTLLNYSTELESWIEDYEEFGIASVLTRSIAVMPATTLQLATA